MNADELVTRMLKRTQNGVAVKACAFFKEHEQLKAVTPSQMNALKAVCERAGDWPSLNEDLRAFLDHQGKRDERVGTTGWKGLADDLRATIQGLYDALREPLEESLARTAEEVTGISTDMADAVQFFLRESNDEVRKRRVREVKFCLAKDFLNCLYRLYRGREVLALPLGAGKLYAQGECHVDL